MSGVALVSGGSRGIGRAVALRLARDGFDVAFCYRTDEDAAREVEKELAELGVRALAERVDVADAEAVRAWVARTEDELGPVTAAVTSAGITRDRLLVRMPDEDWKAVLETNLDGVYHVCRSVVFGMMKRKAGTVIAISSIAGVHGAAGQTNYSASKAGTIGFCKALAKEVGRYGVRVNVVAPGFIDTDMVAELDDRTRERALADIPLRRFGTPDDVADLAGFLASARARYITGSVLHVDGGLIR
ncbi:3-oxoacyl-[acyl-carrier-protein] reductase [Amycolatopsis tolypomycina]|uniref:3-oxoacyl-[acyl-carrier-protein] reductase n=1 Tax=Amycolatopsis tolypomycina TaxID=208445 RepID=A0A1H4T031_9PSEU|nr:3-oxoacyl-[acyl-carrier-protein] reductase [Amycolatopsis tolypomycina]SEC49650.1 3-oxoacyl-[acyl-carrier-protein] reductase [Amycolatopsis tolypomycina]